jgi:hypothetical protein
MTATATKEKVVAEQPVLPPLHSVRKGERVHFTWPEGAGDLARAEFVLENVKDSSEGLHSEMQVVARNGERVGHVYGPVKVNLLAPRTRTEVCSNLLKRRQLLNLHESQWQVMVEAVFATMAMQHRSLGQLVDLSTLPEQREVQYLVRKMLPLHQTSVLFADGGGNKGWWAMALGVCTLTGHPLPNGIEPIETGEVIYLDWETDEREIRRRLGWVCRGMGIVDVPRLRYYQMSGHPLADVIGPVRNWVAEHNAKLVIVDSLVPATGAEPKDAGAATRCMDAVNSLNTTRLVLAHITKDAAKDQNGHVTIFGSAMYNNLGRSNWQLRAAGENPELNLTLIHKKTNLGRLFPALGIHLSFDDANQQVRFSSSDITDSNDTVSNLPLNKQIEALLLRKACRTNEIIQWTKGNPKSVSTTLSNMQTEGRIVQLEKAVPAAGTFALWGMATRDDEE